MAGSDVKLLGGWPSPFVMRPRIALNIKSVDYEFLEEKFGVKSPLLLQSNPVYKKIPVMIHGDKPICESLIIVQYIDDVWSSGPSILPSDPYDRAIARFWATYIDDKFFPSLSGIAKGKNEEERKAAIEQVIAGLGLLEEAFEKCSKGKGFFGGERIGYVDIALGCYLGWIRVTEKMNGMKMLDEAKVPGLAGWADRFCSDSAVKEVMPETEKLAEFAKLIFSAMAKGSFPTPAN
ncbi:Glutathione S-transferase [Macleaya cordata]|uniref:glutathione transferase n=1 Tax=Macleaya cordata TaxID=56857 RepID=A0A200QY01_MACCD|nr:Glutathione S-transferase [Macleaya cordata]